MVKEISSASEFNTEIKGPGLVVVDYFATWCGPCKQIAPFLEELSRKYPNVKFLKVDSDKVQEVTSERRISSLPTFQFFVKGNQVDEIKGADTGPVVDPREARLRFMGLSVEPKPIENTKVAATTTSDASGENILLSDLFILVP
jgi:thioredoxin 1